MYKFLEALHQYFKLIVAERVHLQQHFHSLGNRSVEEWCQLRYQWLF